MTQETLLDRLPLLVAPCGRRASGLDEGRTPPLMAGSVRAVLLLGRQLLRILHLRLLVLRLWRLGWVLLASFSIGYRRLLWWRLVSLLVRLVRLLIGLIRLLVGLG